MFVHRKTSSVRLLDPSLMEYYQLKIMLFCLIARAPAKAYKSTPDIKKQYNSYYDTIYKYSHRKLRKLIEMRSFKLLFQYFVKTGALESMLNKDPTMVANKEKYNEMKHKFLDCKI